MVNLILLPTNMFDLNLVVNLAIVQKLSNSFSMLVMQWNLLHQTHHTRIDLVNICIILLQKVCKLCLVTTALEPKFWPYDFEHYVHLYNVTVHHSQQASPYILCTRKKPNLSLLCTFGCHVYALPPWHHPIKWKTDTHTGIFLAYTNTMKNMCYFDITTGQIITPATGISFDEVMYDLTDKPPNAQLLASLKL